MITNLKKPSQTNQLKIKTVKLRHDENKIKPTNKDNKDLILYEKPKISLVRTSKPYAHIASTSWRKSSKLKI